MQWKIPNPKVWQNEFYFQRAYDKNNLVHSINNNSEFQY